MKRTLSCPGFEQTRSCPPSPKRRQLSPSGGRLDSLPNPTSRSSRTLPLTPETLQAISSQPSAPKDSTQSIAQWAGNCYTCSEPEMVPVQTPSVASNDSGLRRASKLGYRRQRSQSPTKKSSTQYRTRNMADASLFVDHFPEPPLDVEDQLKHIFQVSMSGEIGNSVSSHNFSSAQIVQTTVSELAEKYCHKSRQMAKDCAGEGQWKSSLLAGLVEPMQELWPDIAKLSAYKMPWIAELRPTPPSFEDMLDSVPLLSSRTKSQTPLPPPQDAVLPQTPILSSSNAPSDFTTDDPNRVSIPKPDIAVGLAHASFSQLQGKMLWDLQDRNRVLSEPHQSAIGLHFPFLVIEAKGLAIGSNMVRAQNQAAVDAACALNILRDLKLTASANMSCTSIDQPEPRQIIFSVATEGPIHELWVHYRINEAYHMTLLRIWRTTIRKDAKEFVQALGKILAWGVCDFRTAILKELSVVETILRGRRVG
ncbi:hypothetical protein P154DRAFT_481360 [Amniculicola lignicola CBS 123094]|uniref:DUF7924 domain-containing protein n=1 Tax=Amniculicola lignicola CBS 123094 TaxID=1392246 RepID=A0A6A5WXM8_9PLEO|nr:hypothetical protein P154DRAFT_481360 [Amniculicola lignicola CBS 123094]